MRSNTSDPTRLLSAICRELSRTLGILTVSDAEIRIAMTFLLTELRVLAEPAGATAVAAILAGGVYGKGVGAIVSPSRSSASARTTPASSS